MKKCVLFLILGAINFFSASAQNGAAINTSGAVADPSAIFDVSSNSQGILISRMNTVERNLIQNPATGLMIYNTDCNEFQYYNGIAWISMFNSSFAAPVALTASGINTTGFTANWFAVSGASGYYLDVAIDNGFSSFTIQNLDVGNVTQYSVTSGLTCGTSWYRVRAYNSCGAVSGNSNVVSVSTPSSLQVVHSAGVNGAPVNKTVTYGTVLTNLSGSEKCWITRNMGATQQATSSTDNTEASAGWYYQFNRSQGYQYTTSRTPSTAWITTINENSEWQPANDPCTLNLGSGWRVPTSTEWSNVISNGAWANYTSTYSSVLKLHPCGSLFLTDGSLSYRGSLGYYWSGTQVANDQAIGLFFSSSNIFIYNANNYKTYGYTLRCVK